MTKIASTTLERFRFRDATVHIFKHGKLYGFKTIKRRRVITLCVTASLRSCHEYLFEDLLELEAERDRSKPATQRTEASSDAKALKEVFNIVYKKWDKAWSHLHFLRTADFYAERDRVAKLSYQQGYVQAMCDVLRYTPLVKFTKNKEVKNG